MRILLIVIFALFISGCTGGGSYYDDNVYEEDYREEGYGTGITSDNWSCTGDCSGHEAGYDWASENGITDPYDCDGKSQSFIEGCEAYANEQLEEQNSYEEEYYEDDYYY